MKSCKSFVWKPQMSPYQETSLFQMLAFSSRQLKIDYKLPEFVHKNYLGHTPRNYQSILSILVFSTAIKKFAFHFADHCISESNMT